MTDFADMTETELDENIASLKIQISAYKIQFSDGILPGDDDKNWYRRACTALAHAVNIRYGGRDGSRRQIEIGRMDRALRDIRQKFEAATNRLGQVRQAAGNAEKNAAFVAAARRELPHPRCHAIMDAAMKILMEKDKAVTLSQETVETLALLAEDC
jgi:hypothetical protein